MAIVVVLYDYSDDPEKREVQDRVRPEHRAFLDAQPNLRLAGRTSANGGVLVFEGEVADVEAQLDQDPFKTAGVIASRTVAEWLVGLGPWREVLGLA